ncbi:alpha/beta hydrolase [Pusillimonas noertemannii]|uniref:Acetyl esterase n=1 Tax=Pusillimonas noertemannii TaxID=305977 RepID=A0A2U1CNX1_9BURK|nr:alpha/beta hydrolase [Pusillimonas noertemannii]NYT68275.1 alpha/beta hydrolase [Pusillimonas noertemannii]PVY62710.1 acetyl esterase [Pusillimonas noertemannii]TFL10352.1 alpha/beta hydrolase [Pusillimonas noertemannii]
MTFIHPALQPLLDASKQQPDLSSTPIETARAGSAQRARNRPPGPAIDKVTDLTVKGDDGHEIPIRIYRPANPIGVVIALHGGAWMLGSIDTFDSVARHLANDSGLAVVSVEYRLAPEHPFPAALDDAWAVTCWAAEHGASHGLPSQRLMIMGESAGANLAAVVALKARDAGAPTLRLQALVYPPVDARLQGESMDRFGEGYLLTKNDMAHALKNYGLGTRVKAEDWRLSPLLAPSHGGVAPALLVSAECDPLCSDASAYAKALIEANVPAVHVVYTSVTHLFFGMRGAIDASEQAQKQVASALRDAALK